MKKKYLKKKDFKNAHDTFIYNTDTYCEIIGKKFGKDKKKVKEYFNQFFKFLDSKGLLTDTSRTRINQNIKTFIMQTCKSHDDINALGVYQSGLNKITHVEREKYSNSTTISHEFTHLLTANYKSTDKKGLKFAIPLNKKAANIVTTTGFWRTEHTEDRKLEYKLAAANLKSKDIRGLLLATARFIPLQDVDTAIDWSAELFDSNDICCIPGLVVYPKEPTELNNETYTEEIGALLIDDAEERAVKYNQDPSKIALAVDRFLKEINGKPFRSPFVIYENFILLIDYDGKDNYYVESYYCENYKNSYTYYLPGLMLTEGFTEFLAASFISSLEKTSFVSDCSYDLNMKYAEMLYKTYGNDLLNCFFNQSVEDLARLTDSSIEEIYEFLNDIDNINSIRSINTKSSEVNCTNKDAYLETHTKITSFIYERFASKICAEILNTLPSFFSCKEIDRAVRRSIMAFGTSIYTGFPGDPLNETRESMLIGLCDIYNNCINGLKALADDEIVKQIYSFEDLQKLSNLKILNDKKLGNFYEEISKMCNVPYNIINYDSEEIHPVDLLTKKIPYFKFEVSQEENQENDDKTEVIKEENNENEAKNTSVAK